MKIYVAIIEDRHTDPYVELFTTPEAAIEYAKEEALKGARGDASQVKEEPIEGWLYHANFSCEGDHVRVLEKEVHV